MASSYCRIYPVPSHCSDGRTFQRVLMTASNICSAKYCKTDGIKQKTKKRNTNSTVCQTFVCWLFENSRIVSTRVQASGCCLSWVRIWSAIRCCRGKGHLSSRFAFALNLELLQLVNKWKNVSTCGP